MGVGGDRKNATQQESTTPGSGGLPVDSTTTWDQTGIAILRRVKLWTGGGTFQEITQRGMRTIMDIKSNIKGADLIGRSSDRGEQTGVTTQEEGD